MMQGDPSLYWSTVSDQWIALHDLLEKRPVILSVFLPGPTPFRDHFQLHWSIAAQVEEACLFPAWLCFLSPAVPSPLGVL
jgi:hypothetical protein